MTTDDTSGRPEKRARAQPKRPRVRYKLSELLAQCKGKNPHREVIRGRRGAEIS